MLKFEDIVTIIGILILAVYLGNHVGKLTTEKEAIKYNHAYYSPTTGEFTWKKDCIK